MRYIQLLILIVLISLFIPTAISAQQQDNFIQYEALVRGELVQTSALERWQFFGNAGDTVTIIMAPDAGTSLDPFLRLLDPFNRQIRQDDDSGIGWNASITITLPYYGVYTILAGSENGQTRGSYSLALQRSQPETVQTPPQEATPERTRLGPFQVEWYCEEAGYGVTLTNNNRDWACTQPNSGSVLFVLDNRDFAQICRRTYGYSDAYALRDQNNEILAYNWSCFTNTTIETTPTTSRPTELGTLSPLTNVEVNVRTGPGVQFNSIGIIDWRQEFPLLGEEGTWYIIDYNGQRGYIAKRWASVTYYD